MAGLQPRNNLTELTRVGNTVVSVLSSGVMTVCVTKLIMERG